MGARRVDDILITLSGTGMNFLQALVRAVASAFFALSEFIAELLS